jgi:uncharacterized NAD-dependent epimerase/dehydratase family protein
MDLRSAFDPPVPTIVLAEGKFGRPGGKTVNGVISHSELFAARAVVDSTHAGRAVDEVLDHPGPSDVPVVASVEEALDAAPEAQALVVGVAPAGGELPEEWKEDIRDAIRAGCDVVSGLHVFLSERDEWRELADKVGVRLFDVRKPPAEDQLRVGDGSVDDRDAAVAKVDVDQHQGLAARYGVRGVPTLLEFADGEQVEQISGVQDEANLTKLVERYS